VVSVAHLDAFRGANGLKWWSCHYRRCLVESFWIDMNGWVREAIVRNLNGESC